MPVDLKTTKQQTVQAIQSVGNIQTMMLRYFLQALESWSGHNTEREETTILQEPFTFGLCEPIHYQPEPKPVALSGPLVVSYHLNFFVRY